jgi:hypothetical protein
MPTIEEHEMSSPSGVMLRDACPKILAKVVEYFDKSGIQYLARQLNEVLVVSQALNGTPDNFSFMAYPVPRLNFEQRQSMDLQETQTIDVHLADAYIRIDLDDFGKINWFYVKNLPEMYVALQRFMPADL